MNKRFLTAEEIEELRRDIIAEVNDFGKLTKQTREALMKKYNIKQNAVLHHYKMSKKKDFEYDDFIRAYSSAKKDLPIPENALHCISYRILKSLENSGFKPRSRQIEVGEGSYRVFRYVKLLEKEGFINYINTSGGRRYFLSEKGKEACKILSEYAPKKWCVSENRGSLELLLCKHCA